jgi:tetratricopeptide (TPR) repeat protein
MYVLFSHLNSLKFEKTKYAIKMTDKELNEKSKQVGNLLSARKIKPTFDLLERLIIENGLGEYSDEYFNLEQNYKFMLKYTVEGINDPERQKIYEHLIISTFELADNTFENLRMKYSQSVEYQKKRGFLKHFIKDGMMYLSELENYSVQKELRSLLGTNVSPELSNDLKNEEARHTQKIITLFYHFWFFNKLTQDEMELFKSFIGNETFPFHEKALIVTGLSLSLLRFFDENKILLLFNCLESLDEEIELRALIGLLIGIYLYDQRMPFYHAIIGRLNILIEDPKFRSNLERSILQLIRSKETEKIQRKLQDEILPEMIKLSPNLRNKLSLESLLGEGLTEDRNPEWKEILKDAPGLMGKIEELTEMQLEGADVFLSSFSMLKHFPFFSELANWFYPFTSDHPEIKRNPINKDSGEDPTFTQLIMNSSMLCNSDKYSFYFSILNIPPDYKKMVADSLKAESDQLDEISRDKSYLSHSKRSETIISQYVRDLYRFYKIHPQREGFEDIFAWRFDFHNKYAFSKLLGEDLKIQRNIAEFNFAKNYFRDAADIYEILLMTNNDPEALQKLAYCYQNMGEYKKALNYYLKADLFDQNKLWNLKKIALCYRNLKRPVKALDYYLQAEMLQPDDLGLHVSIGQCQMELDQFEEALKSYYKVEYLSPGNKKIWRPIGWCSFLVGKIEQAEKYFQQLIDDGPNKYDLLNMGHVQWCLGNRKAALNFYKKSINNSENSEKDFMEAFEEDLQHLVKQGVNIDDVPIMLDQLRYSLGE